MDNIYFILYLFFLFEEEKIGVCGIVLVNRIVMLNDLKFNNLKLFKGDNYVFMRSGNLVVCVWFDIK